MIHWLIAVGMLAPGATRDVVARVDGVEISVQALVRRIDQVRGQGIGAPPEQVLEGLVNEALLAREAARLKLANDPAVAAQVEAERRRALGEAFVEREIADRYQPDEAQLLAAFHATADFAWFESLTFESEAKARAARDRIGKGSAFAEEAQGAVVARTYPEPASPPPQMRAQIPGELAKALFAAEPTEVVGPVPGDVGFVVARLRKKQVGDEREFAARREALAASARKQATKQMRDHVVAQLRARSGVVLDEQFIRQAYGSSPSPEQVDRVVATVKERKIRYGEIHRAARELAARSGHSGGAAMAVQLAWKEVDQSILADAAAERIGSDPAVRERMAESERAALGIAALDAIRRAAPSPTDKEIHDFFRRNAARFGRPFEQVIAQAAAGAASEKREAYAAARIRSLRQAASVAIDREALARAVGLVR